MTEHKEPTQEEIREKIAKRIAQEAREKKFEELSPEFQNYYLSVADEIINNYFPEWARAEGWVKLASDQSLPENPFYITPERETLIRHNAYEDGQATMVNSGWRKVIREEKND